MGSDPTQDEMAQEDEQPQHQENLAGYWIGRYPVTVGQFQRFVESSGYEPRNRDSSRGKANHPVVRVTWHDAMAYCRWLSEWSGPQVILPSEAEWEKAVRGTDGQVYPWGNQAPDEAQCNYETKIDNTTPVGQNSPDGDSPFGCADMAGNAWDWTRSLWGSEWAKPAFKYPYRANDGRENLKSATTASACCAAGRSTAVETMFAAQPVIGASRTAPAGPTGFA